MIGFLPLILQLKENSGHHSRVECGEQSSLLAMILEEAA